MLLHSFMANAFSQSIKKIKTIFVDSGWASNSINTVIFRKNALSTFGNIQYVSFYNKNGFVVIGKRKLHSKKWKLITTKFKGKTSDAHNSISIIVDGQGFLHMAWNHHNSKLHYSKSVVPNTLQMSEEMPMTGFLENNVTYPEFYKLPNGNLIFLYRNGQSGQGNLVVNQYDVNAKKWMMVQHNLIDGENKRNAYWQACVDKMGIIHLSWVWRESADVASNHDMCYAKSADGGITWQNTKNEKYTLPINANNAEYVAKIPQQSELINQTNMCVDANGNPIIATYWKSKTDSVPQYKIFYFNKNNWQVKNVGTRQTNFSLSGMGTKRIPISRPVIFCIANTIAIVFKDEALQSYPYIALCNNWNSNSWVIQPIIKMPLGAWEPNIDLQLLNSKKRVNLFIQNTEQKDAEGQSNLKAQPIYIVTFKIK